MTMSSAGQASEQTSPAAIAEKTRLWSEDECVLPQIDGQAPIAIGRLQCFIVHWARTHGVPLFEAGAPTGKRVALEARALRGGGNSAIG